MNLQRILIPFFLVMLAFSSCNDCRYGCENGVCKKRVCECDIYWEGDACERSYLSKYAGEYIGSNTCWSSNTSWEFALTVNPENPNALSLDGNLSLEFKDSSRFDIHEQAFDGHTVTGEGQMLVDRISFYYIWEDSSATHRCVVQADLK